MSDEYQPSSFPKTPGGSLLLGFASLGSFFSPPLDIAIPDETEAMARDWRQVGDDLRSALRTIEKQIHV
jgi:hypothetical protein